VGIQNVFLQFLHVEIVHSIADLLDSPFISFHPAGWQASIVIIVRVTRRHDGRGVARLSRCLWRNKALSKLRVLLVRPFPRLHLLVPQVQILSCYSCAYTQGALRRRNLGDTLGEDVMGAFLVEGYSIGRGEGVES
jgi:hypothetical protein